MLQNFVKIVVNFQNPIIFSAKGFQNSIISRAYGISKPLKVGRTPWWRAEANIREIIGEAKFFKMPLYLVLKGPKINLAPKIP